MSRRRQQVPALPWWLQAGPDTCEFCQQSYHVEAGHYCTDCDAPVCPLCVVVVQAHQAGHCPHCAARGKD